MERYTYHLAVYSKLIRGRNNRGPIVPGSEARIVSHSENFPDRLLGIADTHSFFHEKPALMAMDPKKLPGGVFLYRPFMAAVDNKHFSVFGRLQARSEKGWNEPGRSFTHLVVLIVEDKWQPELIPWAANMLFANTDEREWGWGDPVSERAENPKSRVLPDLYRTDLPDIDIGMAEHVPGWPLRKLDNNQFLFQAGLPPIGDDDRPQLAFAAALAANLDAWDLAVHGRWLPFIMGSSAVVDAPGAGYAIRLDDGDVRPPRSLRWSDNTPPHVTPEISDAGVGEDAMTFYTINGLALGPPGAGHQPSRTGPRLAARNFWPDQVHGSDLSDPRSAAVTVVPPPAKTEPMPDEPQERPSQAYAGAYESHASSPAQKTLANSQYQQTETQQKGSPTAERDRESDAELLETIQRFVENQSRLAQQGDEPTRSSDRDPQTDMVGQTDRVGPTPNPDSKHLLTKAATFENGGDAIARTVIRKGVQIEWPPLPDTKLKWLKTEGLPDQARKRLAVFAGFIELLDDPATVKFLQSNEAIRYFAEAYTFCTATVCAFAITGKPSELAASFESIVAHKEINALGLPAVGLDGLHAALVRYLLVDSIGMEELRLYVKRRNKIARDIHATDGFVGVRQSILEPQLGELETFVKNIGNLPPAGADVSDDVLVKFQSVFQSVIKASRRMLAKRILLGADARAEAQSAYSTQH